MSVYMDYSHKFTINKQGAHYIRLFMNSAYQETSTFTVLQKDTIVHTFTTDTFFTGSNDSTFLKQNVDIKQVFDLEEGDYELKINSEHEFTIYEVHIMKYDNTIASTIPEFRQEVVEVPEIVRPYNKYLIIHNTEADKGGLFWCVLAAMYGIQIAIDNDLIPIIDFYGGFYYSNHIYDPDNLPRSWWNYFLCDPVPINLKEKERVLEYSRTHRRVMRLRNPRNRTANTLFQIPEDHCYFYTRGVFNSIKGRFHGAKADLYKRFFKPLPYITEMCDRVLKDIPSDVKLIGVQYRGTDKYASGTSNEDNNQHLDYKLVLDIIKTHTVENTRVFAASDEQPFIEFMKKNINSLSIETVRSDVNTGGIPHDDFKQVRFGKCGDHDIQKSYEENKMSSVHIGMKESPCILKGLGVIMEVLLLCRCSICLVGRGNVSDSIIGMCDGTCVRLFK